MKSGLSATLLCALAAATLAGCAGRDAHPVDTYTAYDKHLECDEIAMEIETNNTRVRQVAGELEDAKGANVAVGIVGVVLFWPALFALDLSDAEETEIEAYRDRNNHLARLASKNDCDIDFETVQADLNEEQEAGDGDEDDALPQRQDR